MSELVGRLVGERERRTAGPAESAAMDEEMGSPVVWLDAHPVHRVRIDSLVVGESPRQDGENLEHVRTLAEAAENLPPIIVHRPTMTVIDGIHRVQAAILNGLDTISARLIDCDAKEAFILAVEANVSHGLPLSLKDRVSAAERIIADNPQWSDRGVAAATGLSGKTVSRIRQQQAAENGQPNVRMGRDGRLRPLDSGDKRRQAAAMINDDPGTSLRTVARATGLSLATVQDVRHRIKRGEDPVPARYRSRPGHAVPDAPNEPRTAQSDAQASQTELRASHPEAQPTQASQASQGSQGSQATQTAETSQASQAEARAPHAGAAAESSPARRPAEARRPAGDTAVDHQVLLAKLRNDPSLKLNESGRRTLRWLHRHTVDPDEIEGLYHDLPDHCAPVIAALARGCANTWIALAERLRQRTE
ncbi:hypothetical protein ETD83_38635 [Actinomadura soli]|uniref:ParB-like N-terminal domain-containing protein n=1 Tax=Actinomadura soli TaxID=2508997 RepID=A0A5C4IZY2_9ACTN|nr:ParB/RepB/Spo0J family partition protein [Actinomadura soli]TMQ89733.1 hypothetical protein ETD83_38635 [Actinomadura soli]